jgi:hypothetical protein
MLLAYKIPLLVLAGQIGLERGQLEGPESPPFGIDAIEVVALQKTGEELLGMVLCLSGRITANRRAVTISTPASTQNNLTACLAVAPRNLGPFVYGEVSSNMTT